MNILGFCCALNNSYLALSKNDTITSKIIKSDENYHSLYLINEIKEILKNNSLNFNEINLITVNTGPGSFTGIRVALTIARVMAFELNIPIVPLNTAQILLEAYNKKYLLMDARRDMYYLATKDKIELIKKDDIKNLTQEDMLCDKRCSELYKDALCFEDEDKDLASIMIKLAYEIYNHTQDKNQFKYENTKANYIQTPPIFGI